MSFIRLLEVWPTWLWVAISGIMLGLNAPGRHTHLVGMVSLFPLFLVIDRIHGNRGYSWKRKSLYILLACWGTGSIAAPIGVPWLTYAVHVFGNFPWIVAFMTTGLGYGLEVTFVLFTCFGIPMLLIRRRGWWDLLVRLAFFLVIEPFYPRIFNWSFGGMTFTGFPLLSQIADIIGSPGLGIYSIGFSLLLVMLWRWKIEELSIPVTVVKRTIVTYILLWGIGLSYGLWMNHFFHEQLNKGGSLHIVALQPNFTFAQLSSSALNSSVRQRNVHELMKHSISPLPDESSIPKLVVWPESTYPSPYFKDITLKPVIEDFTRRHNIFLLLHSIDWEKTLTEKHYYGIAVLIGPNGQVRGRYNKIFRIPFGEYIPGANLFPAYADWFRKHILSLSEFEKGKDFTVFNLSDEISFSAPICFDVFSPTIIRNMVRNGAELVINLSNLIWFGNTTASDHLEMIVRWRAIENRVPILVASNNGKSYFVNELGEKAGEQLNLFQKGSLTQTIYTNQHFSFYREYTGWIHLIFVLFFLSTVISGNAKGKLFKND